MLKLVKSNLLKSTERISPIQSKSIIANLRQTLSVQAVPLCSPQLLTGAQFRLSQITVDFVYKQLKALNSKKSSGLHVHDIPVRLVKDGAEALARPLTLLMNRTINEGSLPADWKHAIVTPVHKAGSKSDPSNFRPISVFPIFSKILERAVHPMVYSYLQEHRLLSPLPSGFCLLHSTSTCLAHVTNTLLENIDKGLLTGLIFLDLSKAFDTDQSIMLDKLTLLGLNRSAVQWFRSYLTMRTQSVCTNGVLSEPQPISFGVPQSSVPGPLLFIIYINDLPRAVHGCCVELYADDTLIYVTSKSVNEIQAQLTMSDLTNALSWLHANFLILNREKTKIMLVGTHRRTAEADELVIEISNTRLERVNKFKYLGVLLDNTLSWKDQVEYIGNKISSRLGILRRARKVLPKPTLQMQTL